MKIFTYTAVDPDAPSAAVARIWLGEAGWHPVIFTAAHHTLAEEAAQAWWDAEQAKEAAKRAPKRKRAEAAPAAPEPAEDIGDVI